MKYNKELKKELETKLEQTNKNRPNNLRIADMAEHEKPVEKLLKHGAEYLSDAELLAIILRTGDRDKSVLSLAQQILNSHPVYKGLNGLNYRHINDLMSISGVGKVKACQIMALNEISHRMSTERHEEKLTLSSSESVAEYFMEKTRYLTKERVYVLFESSSSECIHEVLLSEGSLDRALLSPRELFKEALKVNAASIILMHNHPSGDPEPSDIDIQNTIKLYKLGNEIGIPILDHIIIGDGIYFSMKDHDLFEHIR